MTLITHLRSLWLFIKWYLSSREVFFLQRRSFIVIKTPTLCDNVLSKTTWPPPHLTFSPSIVLSITTWIPLSEGLLSTSLLWTRSVHPRLFSSKDFSDPSLPKSTGETCKDTGSLWYLLYIIICSKIGQRWQHLCQLHGFLKSVNPLHMYKHRRFICLLLSQPVPLLGMLE